MCSGHKKERNSYPSFGSIKGRERERERDDCDEEWEKGENNES
jgi:hypothetical protein